MTAEPQAQGDLVERDIRWLNDLREEGHCGEGTLERQGRNRLNKRIDRIIATLQSLEAERDQWKADAGFEHLARKKAEAALQSPGLDEEVVAEHIYTSMCWAADKSMGGPHPTWVKGGNALAQDEARERARAIIALSGSGNGSQSQPCADAGTHIPRSPEVQRTLNECWRAVDALGGSYDPTDDRASGYDHALHEAVREIEKLGGMWS